MKLAGYRRSWLLSDSLAGLTVASMAIPQSMAVAQLAGLPAARGLYAVIPAMILYGLFGSSRRIAAGPEPTLAILFAPALAPLAAGDPARYAALASAMALICGSLLVLGGVLRLGFIADFLPRAVVLGYINGVAIAMIVDQLGTLTGVSIEATSTLPALAEWIGRIGDINPATLVVGASTLAIVLVVRRLHAAFPAALLAVVAAAVALAWLGLAQHGVTTIGSVPGGLPTPTLPRVSLDDLIDLVPGALAAAVLIFSDGIITARAFVAGAGDLDENRELRGFGAACAGAGLLQGFPVGVSAEVFLAGTTMLAVLVIGLLPAVGIGVLLALGDMIRRTARPHQAVLGSQRGVDGFHDVKRDDDAQTTPGVIAYRFDAPLFSANAEYLRDQVLMLVERSATPVHSVVLDASAITSTDTDGLDVLSRLATDFRSRGMTLAFARVRGPLYDLFDRAGYLDEIGRGHVFPSVESAVDALRATRRPGFGS